MQARAVQESGCPCWPVRAVSAPVRAGGSSPDFSGAAGEEGLRGAANLNEKAVAAVPRAGLGARAGCWGLLRALPAFRSRESEGLAPTGPAARRAPAVRPPGLPLPTLQLGQVGDWGGGSGGSGNGDPRPRCAGSRWPGCSPLVECTLGGWDRECQGYSNSEVSRTATQGGYLSLQDPETPQALLPARSVHTPERGLPRTRWALPGNILGAPGRRLGGSRACLAPARSPW